MKKSNLYLFLEINNFDFIFFVGKNDNQEKFEILYRYKLPIKGIENNRISDSEIAFNTIKENIYLIEQKFNYTFREIVLILENFKPSFLNITGFRKLNGSQILRENITYILNTLKSYVDKTELNKTILHIFNSKFNLDNKKITNLPVGLFGDFYSHELSFTLINSNDYKNIKNIFDKCNIRIKKILVKSFIKGANISDNQNNIDTFFLIEINEKNSKIFFFENDSLKFEQNFEFGTEIIVKDISKITALNTELVRVILNKINLNEQILDDELLEKEYFEENNYRKIKKKLIYEIALARIKEIADIILFKNINLKYSNKISNDIFLEVTKNINLRGLQEIFRSIFSKKNYLEVNFNNKSSSDSIIETANKLVHFGWKKEAIPITLSKKSKIARFFDAIFG